MSKVTLTDVQTGYRVTSVINDNNATIEEAFDNTISRDGSTPNAMEAPLDLGGHKVLNVAPGTSAADAVTKAQLDSLGQNLPQTVIDQIATRVAEIINEGGGVITPPGGYTNPPAPTAVTTSGVTASNVTLTWTMSDTTWAEGYYIYRNGALLATVRLGATLTYNDTTVTPLTGYVYTVAAYNETYDYESARTAATALTTPADTALTLPGTPSSVAATEATPGRVTVTWAYNSAVTVQGFGIYRNDSYLDSVTVPAARSYIDQVPGPAGSVNVYKVVGINQNGLGTLSSASNTVTIATPPASVPAAPTGVTVTASSATSLFVSWSHSGGLAEAFAVDVVGPNGYTDQVVPPGQAAARSCTITGLLPSTTYSVVVSAIDYLGGAEFTLYPATAQTGTTSAGTAPIALAVATPPVVGGETTTVYTATTGSAVSGIPTFTATGGTAPYVWAAVSAVPPGLSVTSASSIGQITGTPTLASATTALINISCTDAVGTVTYFILQLLVDTPALALTPPAGIASNLVVTQSSAYASGNWVVSGGLAPYTLNISGALPPGVTATEGATTCSINGTGTSAVGAAYPIIVSVTDSSPVPKSLELEYTLDYRATAAVNRAPVVNAPGSFTTNFSITSGTAAATVLDADNMFTDPDGDTMTYSIAVYEQGSATPVADISTLGMTFNTGTGVLAYDGDVVTAQTLAVSITADDGQDEPLRLSYSFTLTPTKSAAFPGLASAGFVASGGDGSYTYSWVSGSIPTWLASNSSTTSINSSTGLFVGGTGNVGTSATYGPYVFRVTDGNSDTADVSVTFTTQDALTDGFTTRLAGSYYATNFTGVYVNGTQVRTITAVNDLADYTNASGNVANDAGTLWGEANGGINFVNHIDWVTDPTGLQAKVAKFVNLPADSTSSGGFVKCVDGRQSGTASGTNYSKLYYQAVFYADRNVFGYRYDGGNGEMKIIYFGAGQESGQVVLLASRHLGLYSIFVDGSYGTTDSRTDPTGYCKTPQPTPFNNTNLSNYSMRPGIVYPASSATKTEWYEAAGYLRWSSAGIVGDLGASLGLSYPSKTSPYAPTRYLDERAHLVGGVDVGWPPAPCVTGGAGRIHLNAWNVVQMCVEYKPYDAVTNPLSLSSIALWTAKYGEAPTLNLAMIDKAYINATGQDNIWFGCYDSNRIAETDRPTGNVLFKEVICSPNRIPFPGGILPTLPAGLTG